MMLTDRAVGETKNVIARRAVGGIVIAAAFGITASGCVKDSAVGEPDRVEMPIAVPVGPSAKVLVSDPTNASMLALGGGKIEVIGGCLGAGGSVIIWPPGTWVVVNEPLTISIPGDGEYSVGDTVKLGGGYVKDPTDSAAEPVKVGSVEVPASCLGQGVFLAGPSYAAEHDDG